jgi:hypothetical protein
MNRILRLCALLLVAFAGVFDARPADAQAFKLALRRDFNAGSEPAAVAVADFNADGKLDYVVTNRAADSLTVRLGDGTGGFGPRVDYATGDLPVAIAVGDLNSDGIAELVVANRTAGTVSLFKGLFGGTFGPRVDFAVGSQPCGVALGDASGDGRPDAVVANFGSNSVTVLVGGMSAPAAGLTGASFTVTTGTGPRAVALQDLNLDGINDLVTANETADSLSVRLGNNAGGFNARVDFGTNDGPVALALGDLNGDGWVDAATAEHNSGTISVRFGNGVGSFGAYVTVAVSDGPSGVAIDDVTGDGVPDVAASDDASILVAVIAGSGSGAFVAKKTFLSGGTVALSIATGDVDGDGIRDLVVPALTPARVSVLLGGGGGALGLRTELTVGTFPAAVAVGDVTGDGSPDLLTANYGSANVSVLANDGHGIFAPKVDYPASIYPLSIELGRLNADAMRDLVVGTQPPSIVDSARVTVLLNNGAGAFGNRADFEVGLGARWALSLGDYNGDTKTDLAVAHQNTTTVRLLPGTGTGGFGAGTTVTTPNGPGPVQLVDVSSDGKLDLLVADGNLNVLAVRLGNGLGGFGAPVDYPIGSFPVAIAAGDLNQDGKVDLAVAHATVTTTILYGDGAGGFPSVIEVSHQSGSGLGVDLGDLNRDGLNDLAVASGLGLAAILGGTNEFGPPNYSTTPAVPVDVELVDVDFNNTLDAVVVNQDTNNLSVFLGRQKTRTALTVTPNPSPLGAMLTFKAFVTEAAPDSSAPTGAVRFFDGLTHLSTSVVINGVATLQYEGSLPWDRKYSAVYVGDSRFMGSISAPVSHLNYVPNVAVEPGVEPSFAVAVLRNPSFGSALRVRFALPSSEPAVLAVYDVRGRLVASMDIGDRGPGSHTIDMAAGRSLAPGVYLVRLVQGAQRGVARAVVLAAR